MRTSCILVIFLALANSVSAQGLPPLPPPPQADPSNRVEEDAMDVCANTYARSVYLKEGDPYDLGHDVVLACKSEIEAVVALQSRTASEGTKKLLELETKLGFHRLATIQIQLQRGWAERAARKP